MCAYGRTRRRLDTNIATATPRINSAAMPSRMAPMPESPPVRGNAPGAVVAVAAVVVAAAVAAAVAAGAVVAASVAAVVGASVAASVAAVVGAAVAWSPSPGDRLHEVQT